MSAIIEIQGLTKKFGDLVAVDDLSLTIEEGTVVGVIGPNGAGKTTTMRILTTLLRPTSGQAKIAGYSVLDEPDGARSVIGYMPDFFGVYEDMKVWEYLDFFAACYHIPESSRERMIADLLALVDLELKRDDYVDELSRGMKQRLCLARTLTHDPRVLILDEPASGLDPRARIEMRELLRELKNMGKTIFFSSHILSEVADVCNKIAILEAGHLVAYGDLPEMKRQVRAHRLFTITTLGDLEQLKSALEQVDKVLELTVAPEGGLPAGTIRFGYSGADLEVSQLLAKLVNQGIPVVSFSEESGNLEDVFLQATRGFVH